MRKKKKVLFYSQFYSWERYFFLMLLIIIWNLIMKGIWCHLTTKGILVKSIDNDFEDIALLSMDYFLF